MTDLLQWVATVVVLWVGIIVFVKAVEVAFEWEGFETLTEHEYPWYLRPLELIVGAVVVLGFIAFIAAPVMAVIVTIEWIWGAL